MTELQNIDEIIANQYFYILYRKIFDIDRTVLTLNVLTLFFLFVYSIKWQKNQEFNKINENNPIYCINFDCLCYGYGFCVY